MIVIFAVVLFVSFLWMIAGLVEGLNFSQSIIWVLAGWLGFPISLGVSAVLWAVILAPFMLLGYVLTGDLVEVMEFYRNAIVIILVVRSLFYICYSIPVSGVRSYRKGFR